MKNNKENHCDHCLFTKHLVSSTAMHTTRPVRTEKTDNNMIMLIIIRVINSSSTTLKDSIARRQRHVFVFFLNPTITWTSSLEDVFHLAKRKKETFISKLILCTFFL